MKQQKRIVSSKKDITWVRGDILEWRIPSDTDLILCDPPYGTGKVFKGRYGLPDFDDSDRDLPLQILEHLLLCDIPLCIFGEPDFLMRVSRAPEKILFWKSSWISGFKSHSCFPRQIDVILCYNLRVCNPTVYEGKPLGNLIDMNSCVSVLHKSFAPKTGVPTEKCPQVGRILTEAFSSFNDLVIDACCGGGSLARGAVQAGRRVIAIDRCGEYLNAASGVPIRRRKPVNKRKVKE